MNVRRKRDERVHFEGHVLLIHDAACCVMVAKLPVFDANLVVVVDKMPFPCFYSASQTNPAGTGAARHHEALCGSLF